MNHDKPVILIVDNSPAPTGAFNSIRGFTGALKEKFTFHFALKRGSSLAKEVRASGTPVLEVSFLELRRHWTILFYLPVLLINTVRMKAYCSSQGIRVVHVNDMYNMTGLLLKGWSRDIRLVYHVRLLPTSYAASFYAFWKRMILRYSDVVIAVSMAVHRELVSGIAGNVRLIYDFAPKPQRAQTPGTGGEVLFLYPANYTEGKGHLYALQAFRQVISRGYAGRLRFVGSDLGMDRNMALREKLRRACQDSELLGKVMVEGPSQNMEETLLQADVVLIFSDSESFSMLCYESMMLGRPVISTDCGGPAEMIENGKTGWLVPVRDVEAMTTAMIDLITHPERRQQFGAAGETHLRKRVTDHQAVQRLDAVYSLLVG